MNAVFLSLANKRWFVPLIIFLMLIITLTSLADASENESNNSPTSLEERLEALCNTVHGVKNAKVMITYDQEAIPTWAGNTTASERILGVAVICDGGDDPDVRLSLYTIIQSLFDITSTRITVSKRNPA